MPRQDTGWGECVECGAMLTPEDAETLGWSDRCEFCLTRIKLWSMIDKQITIARKTLKSCQTEEWKADNGDSGEIYWTKALKVYLAMREHIHGIKALKKTIWGDRFG